MASSKGTKSRLGITLYRLLLRKARILDRNPALKIFVVADRHLFYNPWSLEASYWQSTNNENDHDNRVSSEFRLLCRKFCGYGMYYIPPPVVADSDSANACVRDCVSSVSLFVRECFQPPQRSQLLQPVPSYSYDVAFEAMRYLDYCLRIARNFTVPVPFPMSASISAGGGASEKQVLMPALIDKEKVMKFKSYRGKLLISHPVSSVAEARTLIAQGNSLGKYSPASAGHPTTPESVTRTSMPDSGSKTADSDISSIVRHPVHNLLWRTNNMSHIMSQSVILMIDDDWEDETTIGLVVNKPLNCTVKEVRGISSAYAEAMDTMFPGIELLNECPLYRGGIVYPEESTVFVLHTCDNLAKQSKVVAALPTADGLQSPQQQQQSKSSALYYTSNLVAVGEALLSGVIGSPTDVHVYYGCMSWGPSQLSGEVNMNTWVAVEPQCDATASDGIGGTGTDTGTGTGMENPNIEESDEATDDKDEDDAKDSVVAATDSAVLRANRVLLDVVFGSSFASPSNTTATARALADDQASPSLPTQSLSPLAGSSGYLCWRNCLSNLGGEYVGIAAGIMDYNTWGAAAATMTATTTNNMSSDASNSSCGSDSGGNSHSKDPCFLDIETLKSQRKELRTLSKYGVDGWNGK